jgi:hypothetical protein
LVVKVSGSAVFMGQKCLVEILLLLSLAFLEILHAGLVERPLQE